MLCQRPIPDDSFGHIIKVYLLSLLDGGNRTAAQGQT